MLALGRAMMSEPQLLCLDEPSLGLAPIVVQDIFQKIRAINASGTSVLLVEQNARYAFETASRGYVLQTGSVIASGPCAELKVNPRVQEAYLGRIAAPAGFVNDARRKVFTRAQSAVVTGAGNGIGRAIALAFAEAGANVACVDLDKAAAVATAAKIGSAAFAVACDVSSESAVEAGPLNRFSTNFLPSMSL